MSQTAARRGTNDASRHDEPAILTPTWFVGVLYKQWPLIIATIVAVVAAVGFWTLGQKKIYRSEVLLRLSPEAPKVLGKNVDGLQDATGIFFFRREFFETEFRVMKSMRVALATVRALGLNADPGFMRAKDPTKFSPVAAEDAAAVLISRLSVEPVRDSSLAGLRYDDTDPARCQRVLQAVVRVYLDQNLEGANQLSTSASQWLNDQLEHLRTSLEKSEDALNDFRQKHNVLTISFEDRHNLVVSELESISTKMASLRIQRVELASRYRELVKAEQEAADKGFEKGFGAKPLLESQLLTQLRTSLAAEKATVDELETTLADNHPKLAAARAKVAATTKAITAEVENIRSAAEKELKAVDSQLGELGTREGEMKKQAQEMQSLEASWNQLVRSKTNNEKIYGIVLERARETDLTRMMNFNNIRVVDDPLQPKSPVKPNVPVNLGIASIVGLMLGIVLASARTVSDRSLRLPEDIETYLGEACLGILPEISVEGAARPRGLPSDAPVELTAGLAPISAVAEAARALRTNLMFTSPDRPYNTILTTSAIPEEGKTTVACSLACALAQSGFKVLLIDGDLRRPRLHRVFGVTNDVGVSLAVTGMAEVDDCIHESSVANLFVMPSGPLPPTPAELVQSERFRKLLKDLGTKFDRIVIDSPPAIPVTDAAIMSQLVDGVVVVARARRTQRGATRTALRILHEVNAPIIGVVLNALDARHREYAGYRQYHYYYQYRRDDSPNAAS